MAGPSQWSRNWCNAVFCMWMSEANSLASMVKSQGAEAKRKGSELVNLAFEGHTKESPGLWGNQTVEVASFKSMLYIHIPGRREALMDSADSTLKC